MVKGLNSGETKDGGTNLLKEGQTDGKNGRKERRTNRSNFG